MNTELCFLTATELARRIRAREVSVTEVVGAHLAQIERVNPRVNAIVTLTAERALAEARAKDAELASGGATPGPLLGLPIAHKDLLQTAGIRTTYGSPIYRDHVPDTDALLVERVRAAGAITIGKSNTPEFGAGSQTFNTVFGRTINPYDVTKTCGGSSGGAAVALACGMVPLADGSDLGGSLRNPASFCNVVGLRPSLGRVPVWPSESAWLGLSVQGPMARTVEDVALLLSVISGPDARAPQAIAESGARFREPLPRNFRGVRIAWSRDLGGLPIDRRIATVVGSQRATFDALGCVVEEGQPDFSDAREIFQAWRAWSFFLKYGALLVEHRHEMKDTVVWNIEQGLKLTGPDLARAEAKRTALYHSVRTFMERYPFLVLPVTQVPPFDVAQPYVTEINGVPLPTYIDWMRVCSDITVTGLPAISVPCGFTEDGLPVGIQIVGRHRDEWGVLQLAYAFQQATGVWKRRPALALP
ncbi:MAG TPA: amidase [Methylomirabilota bacterium]|jgi:amidase|nr:amidase [Methylomirabilota bacterium]